MGRRIIEPWYEDRDFVNLSKHIRERTIIHEERLYILYQFSKMVISNRLPGNIAELGVYKGGSAKLLAKVFQDVPEKLVFLFDTFTGMPETDPEKDWHKKGDFSDTSLQSVLEFLADCSNVKVYQGLFSETLHNVEQETFCFAHVDCDIYQSVLECCAFFYPRLVHGGIMIFDDYGVVTCPGAKLAVDEYFSDKTDRPIYLPTGQSFVIKYNN